ncbi:MAG: AAA family ATPase [Novosphingobium sp.]|uniref:AAA family ATPase n=1 Tax=Novosphingobium sp. TaxID=1874826 RepID=UPI0032BB1E7F
MNDPAETPVDIADQKAWLLDYHRKLGSWTQVAKRLGIAQGTISQFGSAKGYGGDEQKVAETIFRFRQMLTAQAQIEVEAPVRPGYFETETSRELTNLLNWAQRGKIVVAALGPGLGKTMTSRNFQACCANVFHATMTPSTAGVNTMQIEVLEALGEKNAVGTPQKLSRRIRERVGNLSNPCIVIDEAQHTSEKALEEIRSWHDATGVGIALLGNIGVMQRLEGGNRASAFAQLYSRVSLKMIRNLPLQGDVNALAEAWEIGDAGVIGMLGKICMTPGGLRNGSHALELACMIAASERQVLALSHLQDAWAQLSSRAVLG